ncbi:MAG: glycosyltransferase family 25 protein [Sphingobacteriales bacterium JAD_PAG50586_3]|nr:MAG: glycosyltransferase family 25 protein [Sphingobacteriales bacterium JAD_PAG50586_3]
MKVFVLNLEYEHYRRQFITQQLEKLGLDYEIQNCVIGKNLTQEELEQEVHMGYMAKSPNWFTPGAIGATITVKRLYHKILEMGLPYALIMEDDLVLSKNLPKLLNDIEKTIVDGEIIFLYHSTTHSSKNAALFSNVEKQKINVDFDLYYPIDELQISMGSGFIITPKAMRGILKANTPIVVIGDSWDYYYRQGGVMQYRAIWPHALKPADFKSTIEYTSLIFKKHPFIPKILKFINDYRIFPIYHYLRYKRKSERIKREKLLLLTPHQNSQKKNNKSTYR